MSTDGGHSATAKGISYAKHVAVLHKKGKKQGKYAETNNLRIPLPKVGISSTIININQNKRS